MNATYRIKTGKKKTTLLKDGRPHGESSGRADHLNHILAWCDANGVSVANDPRSASQRGRWLLAAGEVVR